MRISYLLIWLLVIIGCGQDANQGMEAVQRKYTNEVVLNIPESANQYIVLMKDRRTIRYVTTSTGTYVNTIRTDIELYKKGKLK